MVKKVENYGQTPAENFMENILNDLPKPTERTGSYYIH